MKEGQAWLTIMLLVHRGREDQRPRPHGQVSLRPPERLPKGRQAPRDPARSLALRRRQAADCPGAAEAHWQRRQGGHRQEPPQHAC